MPQDYERYARTLSYYLERRGLPKSLTAKMLHHDTQKLFGFAH